MDIQNLSFSVTEIIVVLIGMSGKWLCVLKFNAIKPVVKILISNMMSVEEIYSGLLQSNVLSKTKTRFIA